MLKLALSRTAFCFFILSVSLFSQSRYPFDRDARDKLPDISELPEPYNSLQEILPLDNQGWFLAENRKLLRHILRCNHSKVIVELGSWLGCSTVGIATWAGEGAKVYAVDHFEGSVEHFSDPLYSDRLPLLYEQFHSNVIHHKLWDRIIPVKMSTLEAVELLDFPINLIYVDAAHDTESVYNDIMAWYPKLKSGGVMCGDDWGWTTVQKAVIQEAAELGREYHYEANFWWFQ